MAAEGERVSEAIVMCNVLDPMAQDKIPMQDIPVQKQSLSQTNPEPEMGAAAAVAYNTSPSLLRNTPPIPAETAHPGASDMAQLFAMMAELNRNMLGNTQTLREEMQCMGAGLQDGLEGVKEGQNQLRGEMERNTRAVEQLKIGQGEVLRETCWGRLAKAITSVLGHYGANYTNYKTRVPQ